MNLLSNIGKTKAEALVKELRYYHNRIVQDTLMFDTLLFELGNIDDSMTTELLAELEEKHGVIV